MFQLTLKLQQPTLQLHNLKTSYSLALVSKRTIGLALSFLECVSLLDSNLICKSYKCFNEGVSVAT